MIKICAAPEPAPVRAAIAPRALRVDSRWAPLELGLGGGTCTCRRLDTPSALGLDGQGWGLPGDWTVAAGAVLEPWALRAGNEMGNKPK